MSAPKLATPVESPSPPALPARFRPLEFAGSGSFGEVWKVNDTWRGADRAAKFLAPSLRASEWRERFFREYALLYKLNHPGLVAAHDFGRTPEGIPFFTMDWVPGPTLADGAWSEPQRLRILWELLDTIGFIHRQELIHADIKTGNVKVNRDALDSPLTESSPRALKLLDFGLTVDARIEADDSRRGTVHYMAPEWFKPGEIDFRIDLYSLGVLLYELWAGRLPFDGDDPLLIIRQHLESAPPRLVDHNDSTPTPISEAVERLLAKQPEIRDKGWSILIDFAGEQFGLEPAGGLLALRYHNESLGAYRRVISAEIIDSWLGTGHDPRWLYLRGGIGLDQDYVLRALVPEISRYGLTPWLIEDPRDPLPPVDTRNDPEAQPVPLLAVAPEQSAACRELLRRWSDPAGGIQRAAISLAAEHPAHRGVAATLAASVRNDRALLLPVTCLDELSASQRLDRFLGARFTPDRGRLIVARAAGNPERLRALAADSLEHDSSEADFASPRYDASVKAHRELIEADCSLEERTAMSLLAIARTEVDRHALRALADIPWEQALSRWLDLGLIQSHDARFKWVRPDWHDLLLATLPPGKRRVVHRAWAEFWATGKPEPGNPSHDHMVYHLLRSDDYRRAVRAGLESARYWTTNHEAQKSLDILNAVEECVAESPDLSPSLIFDLIIANAEARRVLARFTEALDDLKAALANPAVHGNARREAEIYKRIGDLHKSLKQPREGKAALEQALERFRMLDDRVEVARVWNNVGNILYLAGDLDGALSGYQEALTLQRQIDLPRDMAMVLNNIGGVQLARSSYHEARQSLTEAVGIQRRLDNPEGLALSLNNLSVIYVETGQYNQAGEVLRESYGINVNGGKTAGQLFNLENLAVVAMARGEWAEAVAHCETGLKLCDATDDPDGRTPFLLVIAGVALAHGNYDLIRVPFAEVEQTLARIEDADLSLQKSLFASEYALWRCHLDEARRIANGATTLAASEGIPIWETKGLIMESRAIKHSTQDTRDARPLLERALTTAERTGALPEQLAARILLAEIDIANDRMDTAGEHLRHCESILLECSARPLFLRFSRALGQFYEQRGDLPLALSIFDTARKLAKNLTCMEWLWRFHGDCGHILLKQKDYESAVDQFRSALVILEHLVAKLDSGDRELYMQGTEKNALAEGLQACHQALVRQKK